MYIFFSLKKIQTLSFFYINLDVQQSNFRFPKIYIYKYIYTIYNLLNNKFFFCYTNFSFLQFLFLKKNIFNSAKYQLYHCTVIHEKNYWLQIFVIYLNLLSLFRSYGRFVLVIKNICRELRWWPDSTTDEIGN